MSAPAGDAGARPALLAVTGISKRFGATTVLQRLSIDFQPHATTVLIGPSGCGKSTLLRLMVGLLTPDTGHVTIDGETLTADNLLALRRKMGYVIQEGGIFPHLSARDNVALLARRLKRDPDWIAHRIEALAEMAQVTRAQLDAWPSELSGGQRQRIGLMRALMLDPDIILMDEPMGALDPITRHALQDQLKRIFEQLRKTVVLVTHDLNEAACLGAEIALMRAGAIVQRGSLEALMTRPSEPFVSEFVQAQRGYLPAEAAPR